MNVRFAKWGNSIAVRVPAAVLKQLGLSDGSRADLAVDDGRIVLTPLKRRYSLDELVAGITDDNRHDTLV